MPLLSFVLLVLPLAFAVPADDLLQSLRPTADVNDFAGLLTAGQREALEQRCRELRERSGAQLAVVILPSLEGGQIDDFAVKLFERWKIGQAGKDNGVLLLVAVEDRRARIEVGYGLEPILPDALAGRVLSEQLFPAFRQQQYAQGLSAAVNRIASIIERNEPAPAQLRSGQRDLPVAVLFLLVAIPVSSVPSAIAGVTLQRGKLGTAALLLLFPGAAMLIGLLAGMHWLAVGAIFACALGAGWLGYRGSQALRQYPRVGRPSRRWTIPSTPTWHTGSWSSGSSWSGGGFGGGSWGGFGGGSSGGGGASGGW